MSRILPGGETRPVNGTRAHASEGGSGGAQGGGHVTRRHHFLRRRNHAGELPDCRTELLLHVAYAGSADRVSAARSMDRWGGGPTTDNNAGFAVRAPHVSAASSRLSEDELT